MWMSDADQQRADRHERHLRAATRVMLPMMDVTSLCRAVEMAVSNRFLRYDRYEIRYELLYESGARLPTPRLL